MATIRRSGSGWQVLIRRKNYVGPRSKTFLYRDLAESWADAVEERTKKVLNDIPVTLREAINDYINGPLLLHRSAENEKYVKSSINSNFIDETKYHSYDKNLLL